MKNECHLCPICKRNPRVHFDSGVEKFVATLIIGKIESNSQPLKYMPSKGARDLRAGQYCAIRSHYPARQRRSRYEEMGNQI